MKAKKLINKLAIRTKPILLGYQDFIGHENYDYSYTTTPIRILKVTDNHIIYNYKGTKEEEIFEKETYILDNRWLDDNWEDYEKLINLETKLERSEEK